MNRPFAVIGFSMLAASVLLFNASQEMIIVAILAMTVIFFFSMIFKDLRKNSALICSIISAVIFSSALFGSNLNYKEASKLTDTTADITAVVCEMPASSDYAYTYKLKVDTVNGKSENYKIKYITMGDKGYHQGDKVSGKIKLQSPSSDGESVKRNLSEKLYFFAFETDDDTLFKTEKISYVYHYIGIIRDYFINTTRTYLPGENGAIANAMVIGDRTKISEYTKNNFNYSGAAHLLVVSGLHLTMWSIGIMNLMGKSLRLRKFMVPVGFAGLLFYMALTGFTVSVLRAGAMVGGILLGKMFSRPADSINSIGLAVTFILLFNPFSSYSIALWLSVLSTMGLLMFSEKTFNFLINSAPVRPVAHLYFVRKTVEVLSVSIPTTAFTLPIFILKLNMLPVASFMANFFMVGAALLLMKITVLGMFAHLFKVYFIADGAYFLTGIIAEFLKFIAEKIGMAEWSTISVSHQYFRCFLAGLMLVSLLVIILKHFKINIFKHAVVVLSISFVVLSLYCVSDDHNPSVDIFAEKGEISVLINSDGESTLIGCNGKDIYRDLKTALNAHNKKNIDTLLVTDIKEDTFARLAETKEIIPIKNVLFSSDVSDIFPLDYSENIRQFKVNGRFIVDLSNPELFMTISSDGNDIIVLFRGADEKFFKKAEDYDIIIVYESDYDKIKKINPKDSSEIYTITDGQIVNVRF